MGVGDARCDAESKSIWTKLRTLLGVRSQQGEPIQDEFSIIQQHVGEVDNLLFAPLLPYGLGVSCSNTLTLTMT